ncbi:hypothetical protein [Longimicrobium sp.]|uniref:hypothetical protein n=1 Tax=Longimicrobium sp. TaxID=2029185 RepID=UPI003B3B4077
MIKRIFSIAALSMMVAACGGGDEAGEGEVVADSTTVTTVPGTDTVSQPTVVPTTDSVLTTTTTTTDTIQGQAQTTGTATTTDTAAHP